VLMLGPRDSLDDLGGEKISCSDLVSNCRLSSQYPSHYSDCTTPVLTSVHKYIFIDVVESVLKCFIVLSYTGLRSLRYDPALLGDRFPTFWKHHASGVRLPRDGTSYSGRTGSTLLRNLDTRKSCF
jgi:hypothetical protein